MYREICPELTKLDDLTYTDFSGHGFLGAEKVSMRKLRNYSVELKAEVKLLN